MNIRKAKSQELGTILQIYDNARLFMRANGNMFQWANGYPSKELLEADIQKGQLFVLTEQAANVATESVATEKAATPGGIASDVSEEILAVFAYIQGEDPTYAVIENGAWLNNEPYGTIHRMASSGKRGGVAEKIFDWALQQCPNLRGDTHSDNHVMQQVAENYGYKMCGIIYLENGDPRIAYHVTAELKK